MPDAKKKFAETKEWQNILHLTELENGKKMHLCYVSEAQMLSMCPTLWILYYIANIYLGSKNYFWKILEAFKTQKSPSKVEQCQNIVHLTEVEDVKKCIVVTF